MLLTNNCVEVMRPSYYLYPSLLNDFHNFITEECGHGTTPWVTENVLVDRINRVPSPTTEAQQKGKDFEQALFDCYRTGSYYQGDTPAIVDAMIAKLPANLITQKYVSFEFEGIQIYGYVDCVGAGRVIDIKTTAQYDGPKFYDSHQMLYGLAMRAMGWNVRTMEFLVTDFKEVYHEIYELEDYDFTPLFAEMRQFVRFVDERRHLITDTKLFTGKR